MDAGCKLPLKAAGIPFFCTRKSARCKCQAANLVLAVPNPDILGYAFKVIIELACFNLAGTNPRHAHSGFSVMIPVIEKCITTGMHAVTNGDGPSVTVAVEIVSALSYAAFGNKRGFDGDGFHLKFSYCVREKYNEANEDS